MTTTTIKGRNAFKLGDPILLYGDDEPGTPSPRDEQKGLSPRRENLNDLEVQLLDGTILLFGFAIGYLFRSALN
jgi:hypothetical protein